MFTPRYTITDKINSQLSDIAEIKSMVERSHLIPAREGFLRRAAVIKMAHSSTSIEGNILDEYQVGQLVQRKPVIAPKDQIVEVQNYLTALSSIDSLCSTKDSFTDKDILSIHRQVVDGLVDAKKAGFFRTGSVYIVNVRPDGQEDVQYTPPPFNHVDELIGQLLEWAHSSPDIHPIIRAGIFHYQFETIHPFFDGNGRTGRLLTLLHLYQSGWDFRKVLVLEDYYNQNRKNYYTNLQTGETYRKREGVDLTAWLEYFTTGFLEEARRVKDSMVTMSVVKSGSEGKTVLDTDELKIIDYALSIGRITSSDVCDILHIPKRTAQFKLKKLVENHILKQFESGPKSYYEVKMV